MKFLNWQAVASQAAGCRLITLLLACLLMAAGLQGQITTQRYQSARCEITISGTSTLHDWEMKSQQATIAAIFEWGKNQQLLRCKQVSFAMPAASLRSGIETMDNNYMKAIEANRYKEIVFSGGPCAVTKDASGKYAMQYAIRFGIHGRQKEDILHLSGTFNKADSTLTFAGAHTMKMSDFGIIPPSFMMGSVTTGDVFAVKFNVVLKKRGE